MPDERSESLSKDSGLQQGKANGRSVTLDGPIVLSGQAARRESAEGQKASAGNVPFDPRDSSRNDSSECQKEVSEQRRTDTEGGRASAALETLAKVLQDAAEKQARAEAEVMEWRAKYDREWRRAVAAEERLTRLDVQPGKQFKLVMLHMLSVVMCSVSFLLCF